MFLLFLLVSSSFYAIYIVIGTLPILLLGYVMYSKGQKKSSYPKDSIQQNISEPTGVPSTRPKMQSIPKAFRVSEELPRTEDDKSATLRNVTQGIQTQLTSIINLNHAIMHNRYGSANSNIKGASRIAAENGQRLIQLIEEAMELATLKRIKLENGRIHLYALVYELYSSLLCEAEEKNIHIGFNYQLEKELIITLDSLKFKRIFRKLVRNAIQCSPINSQVIISVEPSSKTDHISLTVEDSGIGFSKSDLQHIFDCYPGQKKKSYSYGIVPALVRNYADLFDAELSVTSKVGRGTTFIFTFPKCNSPSSSTVPSAATVVPEEPVVVHKEDLSQETLAGHGDQTSELLAPAIPSQKYRGLIVSNREEMLEFLKGCIDSSYHTLFARERQEVIELLEKYGKKVDFIVCSGALPFVNDCQLLSEINEHETWRNIPLLIVTDEVKASKRIQSSMLGVDHYLLTPLCPSDFLNRIEQVLHLTTERDEWCVKALGKNAKIQITDADLSWLIELEEIIRQEMCNRQFNLAELAYRMATSERQLFRKVKDLTGQTPNKYLRELRMYEAKKLLDNYSFDTVSEVSYAVGFQDPHYFSKMYQKKFGKWPSEYLLKAER